MPIFSRDLHDLRVIDLINGRYGDYLFFQTCLPLTGENAPKAHHWIPNIDKENRPLEECGWMFIQEITTGIAGSYQGLVRRLTLKPNYIKGYIWAISKAMLWGRIAVKRNLMSSTELWKFIVQLSISLPFMKYDVIHGNITGLHTYIISGDRKPILMTPNRFVTRPRGSELIRAWCWYIAKKHEDEDQFISLLKAEKNKLIVKLLKTEKNKLIVKLWLLGAIQDCISYPDYYRGNLQDIATLWREI
jgi:hypothetical protein